MAHNIAAVLPSLKAPLEIQSLPTPTPSPNELLVKVSVTALNAIEAKIAKHAVVPVSYPAILGSSYAGVIEAVGENVRDYNIGERVLMVKKFDTRGMKYGAYQRYVIVAAGEKLLTKVPKGGDEAVLASLVMNAVCVAGLLSGRLGLRRPGQASPVAKDAEKKNMLIYGGSSSFGRLSVQYLAQAGYIVTTTTSPRARDEVQALGATHVIDYTLPPDQVARELAAQAPFDIVIDMISTPDTIAMASNILAELGGGKLYTTQPPIGPEVLPDNVQRVFETWSAPLYEEGNEDLARWVVEEYLPHGIKKGWMTAQPIDKVAGGLKGVDGVLERVLEGAGGKRLVVDVWE
ncbi:GroES-like protein [Stemphylium lycopersici]|nr:alcohol dehydrogenase GroES-like domain-containing protein [Stemphylium lycopersici]RAR03497.1 GroES-like protein [Stemphylium lycopersici]